MLVVSFAINNDVSLTIPMAFCCNCGSAHGVQAQPTDLRRMPLMGLAGAEIQVVLSFPYCQDCASTAKQRRPSVAGVLAVSTLLSILLGMAWLFLGPEVSEEKVLFVLAPIVALTSIAIVLGFYGLRRATGQKTSRFQPVKLKNTGHKWPADITGLELAFTNHHYAAQFSAANQVAIDANKLKVSHG